MKIRFLYPARAYLSTTTIPDPTPVSIQGMSEEFPDSILVSSQGTSVSDQFPDSIPGSSQGTSEEFEDSIPVSSQGISVSNRL